MDTKKKELCLPKWVLKELKNDQQLKEKTIAKMPPIQRHKARELIEKQILELDNT